MRAIGRQIRQKVGGMKGNKERAEGGLCGGRRERTEDNSGQNCFLRPKLG